MSPTQMSKPTEETETETTTSEELEQPPPEEVLVLHEDEEPDTDPLRTLSDTEVEAIYHRLSKLDSTPIVGWGRGLWPWLEIFPEGVSPIGSPTDSPKAAEETLAKPMEEAGAASKIDSPGETSMMADRNKIPPLEEEEAIAELDAAIDEASYAFARSA